MSNEHFLFRDEYLTWLRDVKKLKSFKNYVSDIKTIHENTDQFVQNYLYYVPTLILTGERKLAEQLLACVYSDACMYRSSILSYLEKYFDFCILLANEGNKNSKAIEEKDIDDLKTNLNSIKNYLSNRQVWIVNQKIANKLRNIGGDKKPTFRDLFNIRIYSWRRPCFPLDAIKKIINLHEEINKKGRKNNSSFMPNWVNSIRDSINVYVCINGKLESIKLKEITAIELRRDNVDKQFHVFAIRDGVESAIVLTPLANNSDEYGKMKVNNLDEVSIDHEYPLDSIARNVMENECSVLRCIAEKYQSDPKYKYTESDLQDLDVELLKREMIEVRKATPYRLMERGLNSSKSNNTSFLRYEGAVGERIFIVAENVVDENTGKKYRVYFTEKDKTKRLEEQP